MSKRKAIANTDFLKTQGKNIYNDFGRGDLVQLKGVNIGGYLFQEFWMTPTKPSKNVKAELDIYRYLSDTYGKDRMRELIAVYQENYFTESDFNNLHDLGVNVVRLPFWYMNIIDESGEFLPDWFRRFDWFISEAGKRGIYVILDFHGAPGSQNGSDHSGVDGEDHKEAASEFFFGPDEVVRSNQALYYKIWEEIAGRYRDNPVVAGYDLLNEPYCTYRYTSQRTADELHELLWQVYDEAYTRIRAIDSDHIIIMEATWNPIDLPHPDKFAWTNVMYEYHNYLFDDYKNEEGKQIENMRKKVNLIEQANYDVPSFMGEFSYFDSYEAWNEGVKLLNDAGIHWTSWTYKVTSNYGNWGLYHHTGGDINIEAVDDDKLELIWAKVGDLRTNENLIDVLKKHFTYKDIAFE
ncbi:MULTISPECIES: glycoside hydrolase family 5 protein [unclassified Fusibacter]|uniref:glycoside hydrolase family 5 protein n=1 Tax=unclassified Fusibacter TaxID=2624464 RepID=UPI0013E91426|nr:MULTISPECIES: cellulase family glycosylhydrolase [unclassified Fusibacter]MCK8058131.1 glycoside hydrolase family 5 protein [Fusibacter sp. A2]NPE20713.1 cellulase family glycosylhydrolase [Fusibacter sp. A1]